MKLVTFNAGRVGRLEEQFLELTGSHMEEDAQ